MRLRRRYRGVIVRSMDEGQRQAALKIAVAVKALQPCARCQALSNAQLLDPDDGEILDVLVERAQDLIDDDPGLDVFPDEATLRIALAAVIRETPEGRACTH